MTHCNSIYQQPLYKIKKAKNCKEFFLSKTALPINVSDLHYIMDGFHATADSYKQQHKPCCVMWFSIFKRIKFAHPQAHWSQ